MELGALLLALHEEGTARAPVEHAQQLQGDDGVGVLRVRHRFVQLGEQVDGRGEERAGREVGGEAGERGRDGARARGRGGLPRRGGRAGGGGAQAGGATRTLGRLPLLLGGGGGGPAAGRCLGGLHRRGLLQVVVHVQTRAGGPGALGGGEQGQGLGRGAVGGAGRGLAAGSPPAGGLRLIATRASGEHDGAGSDVEHPLSLDRLYGVSGGEGCEGGPLRLMNRRTKPLWVPCAGDGLVVRNGGACWTLHYMIIHGTLAGGG